MTQRSITLPQLLTAAQIDACAALYRSEPAHRFAKVCCDQVIRPNIAEIEERAGQSMDPMYVAYMVQYVFNQASQRK